MRKQAHIHTSEKVIAINDLRKSFNGKMVLDGVNLDLYRGENLVVLGKSGSGKSVLIKIISGLLSPDSGSVEVLGKDLSQLSKKEIDQLRLKIGFSFQNSALYDSMTVGENLEFPLRHHFRDLTLGERADRINSTLESVGMLQSLNQFPSELSGGQRKRAGIARTLIMQPEIMLYDEPTSGLDPITSSELIELINEVQEFYKTSAIIITHDLTCAKATGDRIAMLTGGKISAQGSFDEVFSSNDEQLKSFYDYNFV